MYHFVLTYSIADLIVWRLLGKGEVLYGTHVKYFDNIGNSILIVVCIPVMFAIFIALGIGIFSVWYCYRRK